MIRVRSIALGAMLCIASSLTASPFTSNGTGGGNWNTSATWGGAGVPGAGDTVTITGGDVVSVTDTQSALTILIDTASTLRIDSGGNLTAAGTGTAVTINAPVVSLASRLQFFGGTMTVSNGGIAVNGDPSGFAKIEYDSSGGTLSVKTDLLFSGSNAQLTFTTGGSLNIGGSLGSGGVVSAGNSTINFSGTGVQTVGGPYTFYNFTVAKPSGTATLAAPTSVFGNLTVSSGILDDGGQQITLNSGLTSNVNLGNTGVLKLGSAASATTFPANFNPANAFFSPGSVVDYHAGLSQVINTSFTYRRLFVTTTGGSVSHSFTGTLTIAEDLTVNDNGPNIATLNVGGQTLDVNTNISGDGTINVNGGSISLGGNWAATSSLVAGAGSMVAYDGNGSQSVLAANYHHLVINKIAGTATFAGTTGVGGNFSVTAGTVDLGTQTVTVNGTLTNNGNLGFNTATVVLLGDLTNNTSIFSSAATLKMNGAAAQAINSPLNAINLAGFEVNNAAGVSVTTNMGVLTTLKLSGGKVTVNGANFVYVDVNCALTRTSGWFVGPLRMGFSPVTPRRMELGTATAYMPIDIDAGSGGDIQARAVEGQQANRTGPRVLGRYWRIESPSSVLPIDVLTFNYNLSDIVTGSEPEFMLGHYNGATWLREGDFVNEGTHTATLTNVSDYVDDDWVVGHGGSMGGAGKLKFTQINGGTNPTANVPFDVDVETWTDDDTSTGDVFANTSVDILLQTGGGSLLGATDFLAPGTHAATISGNTYDTAESGVQLRADSSSGDALDDGISAPFNVTAPPSTLTVTSINDNGPGTLRDAIETVEANGCAVPCTINFSTSGNIVLLTPLPVLNRGDVTIDASTAPGAVPNTNPFGLPSNAIVSVSLDGSNNIDAGFEIFSSNVVIRGFAIKNFVNGGTGKAVKFTGTNSGSSVAGCYIGTDTTGLNAAPNANGVYFLASFAGTAGGPAPADRNVISGNTVYGIYAGAATSNLNILGNYIGTKADLSGPLANDDGIWISSSSDATIGSDTFDGNVISGNTSEGIDFDGAGEIYGNLIGTNGTGTAAIPNNTGIDISGNAEIGGSWSPERNVISGNATHGIHVTGDGSNIDNNYIGVGLDGTTSIPNGGSGIRLSGNASANRIGIIAGNVIAHNAGRGVSVATSSTGIGNAIRQNIIKANGSLAIDLGEDLATPNDATDPDIGANNLQNFPTISAANVTGGNVQLTVSVDSSGSASNTANFIIDVYKTDNSSPTPALEYLGSSGCIAGPTLTNYNFGVPAGSAVSGDRIAVTATSYAPEIIGFGRIVTHAGCLNGQTDGTSELSATAALSGDIHWNNASGGAWEVASNWSPAVVPGVNDVAFIDLSGTYIVTTSSPITVDKVHVGGGISGTQTLNIVGGTSLTINNPSDVTTSGNLTVNGTLTGNGTLDVNGTLDWNAGTIGGVAALNITSTGTLNLGGGGTKTLSQRLLTISNGGAANWTGGSIAMQTGGGIVNLGTFDIKTDNTFTDNGADAGFQNSGTFRKSVTAGTTSFSAVDFFHNAGTMDVQTGIVDLDGGTAAAPISISSGAEVLVNSSLFTFNGGTSVSGAGKVQTASLGILNVDGPLVTIEHLYVNGGTVGGSGVATTGATGTWQWDQGTMSGGGTSRIASGGVMNMPGANAKFLARTLDVVSGGIVNLGGTGQLNLQTGGNISNAGTFDMVGDAPIFNNGGAGAIASSGTFKKSTSSGTSALTNVDLNSTGTISLLTGTLDVAGGTNSGAISISGGATFLVNSNNYIFGAGTTVTGAGGVDVAGGTLTVAGNVSVPKLTQTAGVIDGAGTLTITGTGAWSFGTMQGAGITQVANGATLTLGTGSVKSLSQRALNIVNGGTVDWTAGTLTLNNGANINNTGLFHAQFDGSISNGGTAGTFTNNGTLRKSGTTGFTSFFLPLSNVSGTVDIQNGIIAAGAGYSQGAAGILKLHLAGTTAGTGYGQLNTSSNPTLGGALQVVLVNPFDPAGGDTFRAVLIPGGAHTGDFVHPYTLPALSGGRTWTDGFDSNGLLLSVTSGTVDLDLSSTGPPAPLAPGTPFTFDFVITNHGPATATSVVFTAPIPPGINYNSATPDAGSCNFASNTVTCNVGSIAATNSLHVLLGLTTGTTPGTHSVTGSGASAETDTVPSNNSIPASVSVIGNPLTVVNTNNAGSGSLRQALADAQNASLCSVPCTIAFNIGSGPFVISPVSALPLVASGVIVDATTQPGYAGTPIVQVDGALNSGSPLLVLGNTNAKVKGLSLTGALKGVFISGSNNAVEACSIGIDPAGAPDANTYGVAVSGNNNTIGGTSAGAGNRIAHNTGNGVTVTGTGISNLIVDNQIFNNGGLGIDLGDDGATPNDPGDGDAPFANNRQNSPSLTGVFLNGGGNIHVTYNIDSSAAANTASISVQLFEADSAGSGEGKLPRVSVCHTGSDNFAAGLDFNEPSYVAGTPFVMTATSYSDANCTTVSDGTSEFSNVVLATTCVPPAATISAPANACAGSTNNAASVNAPGATSFNWTVGGGGTLLTGQGTPNITFSAPAGGTVTLSVAVTNAAGCSNTAAANVPVTTPPAVTITGPTTACPLTTFTLDAGVFATYQWSNGSTSRFLTVSQSAPSVVYSVTVTNGGCSASDTHTVTLTPVNAAISAPPNVAPSSGGHTASVPSQPGAAYAWSIGNGAITSGAGTNSITFSAGASGNVNISVTVSQGGCSSNGFVSIPIDSPPADPCDLRGTPVLLGPANAAVLGSSPVVFSWLPSPTATASRVWLALDGAPPAILGEVTGNTLTANVAPGHAVWFVEDLFAACPPSQSGQRTFTIPAGACSTAQPVITAPANHSSAGTWSAITWTSVPGALSYEVWTSFEDGGFVRVGTTSDTSLEISPWSAGTYDFFVRALASLCAPADSAVVRFTYAPSAACLGNQRAILISPLDGDIMASPASFSWSPRPGSTLHEVYVVRENGAPERIGSTTANVLNNVALASGPMRWFVRSYFGPQCSPLDSERQDLTIVNAPAACSPLTPPVISAPGEISSGVEFLLQWTSDPAATGYELQVANNGSFAGAEVITTGATSHALTRGSGIVFARVRGIDNRCTPQSVGAFGPTAAIFILPPNASIGTVPLNAPNVAHYTIALGPEFAGQTFSAVPSEEWLTVSPAAGTVGAGGTTLNVTANSEGLGLGANTGAVHITLNTPSAGSIAIHATTVIVPSISVNVVTPVKPSPSNTPSPDTMIIPGVANADGINSHFQSDVRVANTSPQLIKYQLTFIPSGEAGLSAARQTTFSIEPGRTIALDDVLKSWFGTGTQNAIGVLEIKPLTQITSSPTAPPIGALASLVSFASSRTFNVAANGTFGQYIPAIPFANFIDRTKSISLQQISQSAKYRSNLALFEGSGQAATVLIKVFGSTGQQITQFTQSLAGGQHTQLNSFLLSRGITLDDGRVEVSVTSSTGKVTAVASVLDNQTSDAITVVPVTLEESGNTKWVIPGVADIHSGFANWQSDVRIFNANTSAADVTATFYSQAGGEPKVQTIHMNPGEVKQYDKVLASLFGVAADGGALHLSTAQPSRIIATARTYNDTPTGTYGQFISAVTPGEAVGVGSRPLQILQVEESARMRSNVAFAEVTGKPVKLEVTVTPPDAKFTASIEVDLAANEFRQIGSILASTLGLSDTYNARISVRAISGEGRALACASVIDLQTNDPTLIQAQ